MSDHPSFPTPEELLHEALRAGAFGAVVGSMAALPSAYDQARAGAASREQALHQVLRSGAQTALAAGVGATAAALVGRNHVARMAAMLLAGGATLHLLTSRTAAPAAAPAALTPATPAPADPEPAGPDAASAPQEA